MRILRGTGDYEEIELPEGDQIGHHIRSQCSESVFVSTEDYLLRGGNEDFEIHEESSMERASLFRSWTHQTSWLFRCRLDSAFLIGQPQDIVCFFKETLCHEKQEAEYGLSVQYRVEVQGDGKCNIKANLDQKSIDKD